LKKRPGLSRLFESVAVLAAVVVVILAVGVVVGVEVVVPLLFTIQKC
jgi:hypothetical protein